MIYCSRNDCDFWLEGKCEYGGEAVNITTEGCQTYEPMPTQDNNDMWDVGNLYTEDEMKIVKAWNEING